VACSYFDLLNPNSGFVRILSYFNIC